MDSIIFPSSNILDDLDGTSTSLITPETKITKVHIRMQQRNARKRITTIDGLSEDLDLKKILKAMKKLWNCGGALLEDTKNERPDGSIPIILKFNGDMRQVAKKFLIDYKIVEAEHIVVHGF